MKHDGNGNYPRKRGRWSAAERVTGARVGVALTEQLKQTLLIGIQRFYLSGHQSSLRDAYHRTLIEYFCVGCKDNDGVAISILAPASELPTFRQFCYVYHKY